tara:strand:- start:8206 stop:8481 length:276 start_codon:yes stop_codon:yes gene_type:complete
VDINKITRNSLPKILINKRAGYTMEYFTLLTVYYNFLDYPMEFSVWFYNKNDCWDAVINKVSIYKIIEATEAICQETDMISKAIAPKLRPW